MTGSVINPAKAWLAFLDEFRHFGGRAKNVIQREGPLGFGLFPIDPRLPVEVVVPKPLLVPADNVELRDGDAVIRDDCAFPDGYADWFHRYQAHYSWGAEGRYCTKILEDCLKSLPNSLQKLQDYGLLNNKNRFPGINEEQELFK